MLGSKRLIAGIILFVGALAILIPFIHSIRSTERIAASTAEAPGQFVIGDHAGTRPDHPPGSTIRPDPSSLHLVVEH